MFDHAVSYMDAFFAEDFTLMVLFHRESLENQDRKEAKVTKESM